MKAALYTLLTITCLVVLGTMYNLNTSNAVAKKGPTIQEEEMFYPTKFIDIHGTIKQRIFKNKLLYTITNRGRQRYKNLIFNVTYVAKTGAKTMSKNYKLYEFIEPLGNQHFTIDLPRDENMENFYLSVVSAEVAF